MVSFTAPFTAAALLMLTVFASTASAAAIEIRQDGCERYGNYPEYTGPRSDTSEFLKPVR